MDGFWNFGSFRSLKMSGSHFPKSRKKKIVLKKIPDLSGSHFSKSSKKCVWIIPNVSGSHVSKTSKNTCFEKSKISRRRRLRRTNSQFQIQAPPNAPRDEMLPQGKPLLLICCRPMAKNVWTCMKNDQKDARPFNQDLSNILGQNMVRKDLDVDMLSGCCDSKFLDCQIPTFLDLQMCNLSGG